MSEPRGDGVRSGRPCPSGADRRAATRVFAEKGFRRATTGEVARAAGVSEGTIYNYFEDKDALADDPRQVERDRAAGGGLRGGMAMDFRAFLEQYLRRRMSLIWENKEVFRVVLSEILVNAEWRERYLKHVVDPTMSIAEENFRSRLEQEEMRKTEAPLAMSAAGAVGVLVLGLLGDEEINSRWEEVPDVLVGLPIRGPARPRGIGVDSRGKEPA